jgi:hypothetical protein
VEMMIHSRQFFPGVSGKYSKFSSFKERVYSHHQRELSVIPQPKMLLADDFKAYSKDRV